MGVFTKAALAALAAALSACGGGGGGGADGDGGGGGGVGGLGGGGGGSGLSENQRLFEEFTLSGNGGSYFLSIAGAVRQASASFVEVSMSRTELPVSPEGVPGGVDVVYTPATAVIAALPIAANRDESNENVGSVMLEGGQLLFAATRNPSRVTYVGEDILVEWRTASGQVAQRTLVKSHEKVTLTGTMATAPQEFRTLFGYDAAHIDPAATFAAGSAYYKQGRYRLGDHVFIADADQNPNTDPKSATPLAMGTIEQYAAAHPATLVLANGTIRTLKGARCWVQNTTIQPATSYTAYCEVGPALFRGTLAPDGSQMPTSYPVAVPLSFPTLPFSVRLNQAAAASVRTMFR